MAKRAAAKGPPSAVTLFIGEEPLLLQEAWAQLLQRVFGGPPPPMAVVEFEGPTAQPADVLDELRTPTFLGGPKVVRVTEAERLLKGKGKAGDKASDDDEDDTPTSGGGARDLMVRYAEAPAEQAILVLQVKSEPRTTRLHKLATAMGGIVECAGPARGFDPAAWCADRAQSHHGKTLAPDAADALAEAIGPDLTQLANELGKLAAYVGDASLIQSADVSALVGASRVQIIFEIADSVAAGDVRGALTHFRRLLDNDRDARFRAVAGLVFSFRRLLHARRLLASGMGEAEAAQSTGLFALRGRLAKVLGPLSVTDLESALADLLHVDHESKSGQGDLQRGVERMIVKLARARRPA